MTQPARSYTEEMRACAAAIDLRPPAIVQPEDRWFELNGTRFHYLDWGNASLPPLVLLHGGGLTAHTSDMASLLLRDRYHIIALDQRGHGDSGWTPEARFGEDNGDLMLEDTTAFVEQLGYARIVLCGMSMGGMNAIRYAARHSERLSALVVVDVGPVELQKGVLELEQVRRDTETLSRFEDFLERAVKFNPQRRPAHLRYSLLHSLKQVPDGWTWKQDHRRRPRGENPSADAARAERERRSAELWRDWEAIRTPTLLMRGAISNILSDAAAQEMLLRLPGSRLVIIPGAGHSVQGDNPRAFAEELERFLSTLPAAAT
jgi:esterase